jgi:hypothetical protein
MKVMMTGAICVAAPGSPVQIAIATLVLMMYLLLVLKAAPYSSDLDDWMAAITTLALVLTTFAGLMLITDDDVAPRFDSELIGNLLIFLHVTVLFIEIGAIFFSSERFQPMCLRIFSKCGIKAATGLSGGREQRELSKVVPARKGNVPDDATLEGLRRWGRDGLET